MATTQIPTTPMQIPPGFAAQLSARAGGAPGGQALRQSAGGVTGALVQFVYTPITGLFSSLGLLTPGSRAIAASLFFYVLQASVKPSISYHTHGPRIGTPRSWSLLAGKDCDPAETTMFPWFLWPVSGAVVFGGLI
jgi:hypothetical protein